MPSEKNEALRPGRLSSARTSRVAASDELDRRRTVIERLRQLPLDVTDESNVEPASPDPEPTEATPA